MICLFSSTNGTSLEAFKKSLHSRIKFFIGLGILGFFTSLISLISEFTTLLNVAAFISGFLLGFGFALIAFSIVFIIRTRKILKDEALLKKERLKYTDERNIMIGSKSMQVATVFLVFTLYICFIICIFIQKELAILLAIPLIVFAITVFIARYYFNKHF